MRRTKLKIVGDNDTSLLKQEIQALVREIVTKRDGTCILRKIRKCNDDVLQADHLISRANSGTYADTRLIVCLCRTCHGWKNWWKEEYDAMVKTVLSKETIKLWERCEEARHAHKTTKMDWRMEIVALKKELSTYPH